MGQRVLSQLIISLLMLSQLSAQSLNRNPEWLLPPEQLSFTSTSVSSSTTSVPGGAYNVSNAAFDESGNLLFYVQDGYIYDANSILITLFPNNGPNPEVAICPKPGTCDQYYVFSWGYKGFVGTDLDFATVTVSSGGTLSVSSTSTLTSGSIHCNGIAVSQPFNASMDRYLYAVTYGRVDRFLIENSGVSFDVTIASSSDLSSYGVTADDTPEAELAGDCVAWGSLGASGAGAPEAYIAVFDLSSGALDNIFTLPLPDENLRVAGLEFGDKGRRLYVSAFIPGGHTSAEGVYYFDAEEEFELAHKLVLADANRESYSRTHIERGRNERFYLVSESGKLSYFEQGVEIIDVSPLGLTVPSFGDFITESFYTLPDQNDDDDYNSFTGYPAALITDIALNAITLEPGVPPTAPDFYTCNPLDLVVTTAGDVVDYRIGLVETNPTTGAPVAGGFSTTGGWTANIPTNFDLKSLSIPSGTYLQSNTGHFAVTLDVRNTCDVENGTQGQFDYQDPTPVAVTQLTIEGEDVSQCNPLVDLYQCNPLGLSTLWTGSEYRLRMFSINPPANCGEISGAGLLTYSSNWTPGPPVGLNLKNLPGPDPDGTWLQTNTGPFGVELQVRNECLDQTSEFGYFDLNEGVDAANIVLDIQTCANLVPASTNLSAPVDVCYSGAGFTLGASTNVDYYRIDAIEEVNCLTGQVIDVVHTETTNNFNVTGPGFAAVRNFNNITVTKTGMQGYFDDASMLGRCFKATFTVGNVCGEATAFTYFTHTSQYRLANPTLSADEGQTVLPLTIQVGPNPFEGNILISYELPRESPVRFEVLDATGKVVARPDLPAVQQAGSHRQKLSLGYLPAGMYLWRMQVGSEQHMGRLIRM